MAKATFSLFDPSLTPHNARQKGYDYIDDVIYDMLEPNEAMKDIIVFSRKFKCKLGTPSSVNSLSSYFGLYMPRQEKPQRSLSGSSLHNKSKS